MLPTSKASCTLSLNVGNVKRGEEKPKTVAL